MTRDNSFSWLRQFFNCAADLQTDEEGASKQTYQNPSEAIVSDDDTISNDCDQPESRFESRLKTAKVINRLPLFSKMSERHCSLAIE